MENRYDSFLIGWCAGFFEGEGSLSLYLNGHGSYSGRIEVVQKAKEPLIRFQNLFGGHIYPRYGIQSEQWKWCLNSRRAKEFLKVILPHLQSPNRIEKVERYIAFYSTKDHKVRDEILEWWETKKGAYHKNLTKEKNIERFVS